MNDTIKQRKIVQPKGIDNIIEIEAQSMASLLRRAISGNYATGGFFTMSGSEGQAIEKAFNAEGITGFHFVYSGPIDIINNDGDIIGKTFRVCKIYNSETYKNSEEYRETNNLSRIEYLLKKDRKRLYKTLVYNILVKIPGFNTPAMREAMANVINDADNEDVIITTIANLEKIAGLDYTSKIEEHLETVAKEIVGKE